MAKNPRRKRTPRAPLAQPTRKGAGKMAGGGLDFDALLGQVRQIQNELVKAQQELRERVVSGSAGGGMVEVSMRGDHTVVGVKVDPECVDPQDLQMLEDLIAAAVNDAVSKVEDLATGATGESLAALSSVPGLSSIPGLDAVGGLDPLWSGGVEEDSSTGASPDRENAPFDEGTTGWTQDDS